MWKGMRKGKFSVYSVGRERKCRGGTEEEDWNRRCLGPKRLGLESLIQGEWQELSIKRQCKRKGKQEK